MMCGIEIPHNALAWALGLSAVLNAGLLLVLRRAWKEDSRWRR